MRKLTNIEIKELGYWNNWYEDCGLSYSVYQVDGLDFQVTNDGHGYWKWNFKGIGNTYSGQAHTKAGALSIINQLKEDK